MPGRFNFQETTGVGTPAIGETDMLLYDRPRYRQAGQDLLSLVMAVIAAIRGARAILRRHQQVAACGSRTPPPYYYGYISIGVRDRATVVALAMDQIIGTAPHPDERLLEIISLLRDEFADERRMAIADRELCDA